MSDYRVNLDIYNGPLDLLLYLIRRDEVDLYDIPIARITRQYVEYVELIKSLDPNLAGEFLVMAATLMELKTRMLLPAPPPAEAGETGTAIDPRAELVRQLLEYKAFKDAAAELGDAAALQALRFPRRPAADAAQQREIEIEDVQVWDLVDAFGRILTSIGQDARNHQVIYDDTPLELHADDIVDRLSREGQLTFEQVFEGRTGRSEIIGLFLAMLELVRQKRLLALQESLFGQIHIRLAPAQSEAADSPAADAADSTQSVERTASAPQIDEGFYVGSEQAPPEKPPGDGDSGDDNDDTGEYGAEDQGIGV